MARALNCNWWKYSQQVYNVGWTAKYRSFSEEEREAVIDFIIELCASRPQYAYKASFSFGIPKQDEASTSESASSSASASGSQSEAEGGVKSLLEKQDDSLLGRALKKLGRTLKVTPPSEEEKELCDALFEAVGKRIYRQIVEEKEESTSSSGSASASGESEDSASESQPEASSSESSSKSESKSE